MGTHAFSQLLSRKQSAGFNHGALAMHPLGLNRVKPGTFGRQKARRDADALPLSFHLSVMLTDPGAHEFAHMPGGIIDEKAYGPDHREVATDLNNLALLYYAQGKYSLAEPLYQRALAIREQQLGPEHPDTAGSLNNLAGLYRAPGKYEQAEPLYQRALAIVEKQLGPKHPTTATIRENYHALVENMQREEKEQH